MHTCDSARRGVVACCLGVALAALVPVSPAFAGDDCGLTVTAVTNGATSAAPRSHVIFTLGRVDGIDPTTEQGRAAYARLRQAMVDGSPAVVDSRTLLPTGTDGITGLSGLPKGVYVLHEVGLRDGAGDVVEDPHAFGDVLLPLPLADDSGKELEHVDVMPKEEPTSPPLMPTDPIEEPTPTPSATGPGTPTSPATGPGTPGSPASTWPVPEPALPQVPAPVGPTPSNSPLTTTRINSGGGSEFDGATQWATIVAGGAVVSATFLATRGKKDED